MLPPDARLTAAPIARVIAWRVFSLSFGASAFLWVPWVFRFGAQGAFYASHNINLYPSALLGLVVALCAPRSHRRVRLLLIGGGLWLLAALASSAFEADDPRLALFWSFHLGLALALLVRGASSGDFRAGLGLGCLASLPLMIWQVIQQRSSPGGLLGGLLLNIRPEEHGAAVLEPGRWLRPYGLTPHPNITGGLAALACVLLARAWLEQRRGWQLALVAVAWAEVLLSFSRSAWAGCILGMTALLLLGYRRHDQALLSALAVPLMLFFLVYTPLVTARVSPRPSSLEASSLTERFFLARTAMRLWLQDPLLGVGPANAGLRELALYGPDFIPEPIHDGPLLVLAETGLVGLLGAALATAALAIRALRTGDLRSLAVLATAAPPLLLDHYLLTTPVGLLALAGALSPERPRRQGVSRLRRFLERLQALGARSERDGEGGSFSSAAAWFYRIDPPLKL